MQAIWAAPTQGLLRDAILFDVYRAKPGAASAGLGEGEKSLAVRLTLNGEEATLTEEQIESAVLAVLGQLTNQLGARLRA
jgi:phenylalanyl-tRNA synthetase beta chain